MADQAIVSLGTFILGIALARTLSPAEYGAISILFGVLFLVQIFNTTLVFYPMTMRCSVADRDRSRMLITGSLCILAALCVPLCVALAIVNLATGRSELILPSITYFLCWQVQEHCRRGLFAQMRYRGAIIGDAVSYLGQTALVLFLIWYFRSITMAHVFYAMALTSAVAAVIQAIQLKLHTARSGDVLGMWRDFWQIGRYSLISNVLAVTRFQLLSWTLAGLYGAAATASFQAALNILNVANPVVFGLLNIIPQLAARAHQFGKSRAWEAAWTCAAMGAPVIFVLYGLGFAAPNRILLAFYGSGSPYLDLDGPVRILALAFAVGYATEAICAFLHGIDAPKFAFITNAIGVAVSAAIAIPLVSAYGVTGAALATLISAIIRLLVGQVFLKRLIGEGRTSEA